MVNVYLEVELTKLKKKLLHLGAAVEESLQQAITALARRDSELAIAVIENDVEIDRLEVELEEECLKVLALHQPVAVDLRLIVATLKINNDLERIADLSANIAERAVFLSRKEPVPQPFDVVGMAEHVRAMVRKTLDAFVKLDADLAYEVCATDDHIDSINRETYPKVARAIEDNPERLEALINYLSISRYLERVADHATNIAEDVLGLLEGEIVRHRVDQFGQSPGRRAE